ncbi:M16 family metallopeptidase [Serinibacter arcticus]|uniref:Peptidase, M16 family n=1 Tax=Serinibacter arcticus TaxID=1655435 RepID=A0A4Z1E561_9MICO|nr:pitrilysin family protein [Serinibacter arcticus]TGO05912.1 peptidase, M16 family [Serinibacter arcticus]
MPRPLDLEGPGSGVGTFDHAVEGGGRLQRTVLPGGIRVLTEAMPGQRSVSVSATVAVGSRDEHDGHHGSTHFLEHLLFKGTPRRDALEIAEAFDEVGGEANAATGKESTSYFARVLDADRAMAVDVLLDMVTSATLEPEAFELERGVILEEIAMTEDDPADVAHETFTGAVFGQHALGRPIGGTPETIRSVPREAVLEHYRRTYGPSELVVTAAGGVDHDELCELVLAGAALGGWDLAPDARPVARRTGETIPEAPGSATTVNRPTEQANILLGGRALPAGDPRRFAMSVLNAVLGGGMSSRLFQEIRERRGLAYSTYSFSSGYTEAGLFGLYAGCTPGKVTEVVAVMDEQWRALADTPVSADELRRAVGQLSGSLVLGLEDTGSRMARLTRSEISLGELWTLEETLEALRAVTAADVQDLAADLRTSPRSLVVVGPFTHDLAGELLARTA